jgi:hypothetical protein
MLCQINLHSSTHDYLYEGIQYQLGHLCCKIRKYIFSYVFKNNVNSLSCIKILGVPHQFSEGRTKGIKYIGIDDRIKAKKDRMGLELSLSKRMLKTII